MPALAVRLRGLFPCRKRNLVKTNTVPENNAYSVLVAHISASHGVSGSVRLKPAGENAELLARALPVGRKALGRREDGTERILTVFNLRRQKGLG